MDLLKELKKKPYKPDFPFPASEYAGRMKKVQAAMARQGIDMHLISFTQNLGYLTGYDTTMPSGYTVGMLPAKGKMGLHCSELEGCCALQSSTIKDIELYRWYDAQDTGSQLGKVLLERGYDGKRIGIEMRNPETFTMGAFDTGSFLRLKELLPNAEFVDTTDLIMELRLIKSAREIAYMKKAGDISWRGLNAALAEIGEGRSDNDVIAAGHHALIASGSELMSADPMIMSGERTGWMPHVPYKRHALKRGDSIYLEFTGTYHRYNAPAMRSAAVGTVTDQVRRLADVSLATVELILEHAKPGRTGHDVARDVGKVLRKHKDIYFHGAFAYSIGMSNQPTWGEAPMYIAQGIERELKAGMCFHCPICLFVPRGAGLGFSESITITRKGCDILGPGLERELKVR
jgi:Xaa-Pro dipeptidase